MAEGARLLVFIVLMACRQGSSEPAPTEAPVDPACPVAGFRLVPASPGPVVLGSAACTNFPNVLMAGSYQVAGYCMQVLPFPGVQGLEFVPDNDSPDGLRLSYPEVLALDERLRQAYGLRLCTVGEYLWASAGPENHPFSYGATRVPGRCAEDADGERNDGYRRPMGSDNGCVSWAGIRDIGTRNAWAQLDHDARAAMDGALSHANEDGHCELHGEPSLQALDPGMELVVMGASIGKAPGEGSMSGDLFGVHWHLYPGAFYDAAPADPVQWADDQLRLCADPKPFDAEVDARWQAATQAFLQRRDYAAL